MVEKVKKLPKTFQYFKDEDQFAGGGAYLFCSVLERFLGLYVSLNSFSQLSVTTLQRKEALAEWQPRSGSTILT